MKLSILLLLFVFTIQNSYCLNLYMDLGAGSWSVINSNNSVQASATVPGGIYTDLKNANILTEEFYYRFNDHEYRWVSKDDWTYSRTFRVTSDYAARTQINIVFEGLDTIATVTLNGNQLCGCDNMFRRYIFSVKQYLNLDPSVDNVLVVSFRSPVIAAAERSNQTFVAPACVAPEFQGECSANQLRKMQASFSWDWGPAFPSVGIWRPVYLEAFDTVLIRDVTYDFAWLPSSGRFEVTMKTHVEFPASGVSFSGDLIVNLQTDVGSIDQITPITVTNEAGKNTYTVIGYVNDVDVEFWWPNGWGNQPLYNATVKIVSNNGDETIKTNKIGYRTVRLVQTEAIAGDPSKGLNFYFSVNNKPIFSKGSNWIPSHVLPELGAQFYEHLLHSSKEAGFNMLRIWGGGIYEDNRFYELCDELGILIWQDFLFACSMYPVDTPYLDSVEEEVRDTVRKLQYHPSIVLWAGNNENEAALRFNWYGTQSNFTEYKNQYIELYVNKIKPIVNTEDPTRSFAVSSPSNGIQSELDGYIADNPYSPIYGDVHYYNYLNDGWDANTYPRTRFSSEFGFQSLSSMRAFRSVSTAGDLDLGLNSRMMTERQHHPNGNTEMQLQVTSRLLPNNITYSFITESSLEKFIPLTQIYQAMATKTEAECHRRWRGMLDPSTGEGLTMGSLYWQLNDIWQGPTWAGIEHDGTWKPLHYYSQKFYNDVLISSYVTPGGNLSVHVSSDLTTTFDADVQIDVHSWSNLNTMILRTTFVTTVANQTSREIFTVNLDNYLSAAGCGNLVEHYMASKANEACFIVFRLLTNDPPRDIPENFLLPSPLGSAVGLTRATLTAGNFQVTSAPYARYVTAISFSITTNAIAPFVWLDAGTGRGRFSDNGFILFEPNITISYYSLDPITIPQFQAALKMSSLLDYW